MKKLIFTLSILFAALVTNAQNCTWHEDFDAPSLDDSVRSSSYVNGPNWFHLNQRLFVSSANSDSAYLGHGDTVALTTTHMNFTGMNFVLVSFDQICKINPFDRANVYWSPDSLTWYPFTCTEYTGPSQGYCAQLNNFSAASYGSWFPGLNDTVPFDNSWWQHESFDISDQVQQQPDVWLSWRMYDSNNDLTDTMNGWHIDNICVQAAPCELTPPLAVQLSPIYSNVAYNLGPYILNDSVYDQSNIQHSYLIYTINGVGPDTIDMTLGVSIYLYSGTIPAVNAGDTVCYWFSVIDDSGCDNTTTLATHCFVASSGISFPYCPENFDAAVLWSDTTIATGGSSWQLGTPAFGSTTGALSPPNAWDIDLTSGYLNNSECYLYSPVFGMGTGTTVNARITFYRNTDIENFNGDGVTLQYSNDLGVTWHVLNVAATGGSAVNWYTNTLFANNDSVWDGNSGGWIKSDYIFGPTNLAVSGSLMLRFRFLSDGFGTLSGMSIDNMCFTLPENNDPGISNIVSPTGNAPAGTCVPVTVNIHNYGSNNLDSTNVYYAYNGITYGPFLWSGPTLAPGQETQFTMPCDTLLAGANDICAWVVLGADINHSNDTSCASIFGIPTVVIDSLTPYCDNFDSGTSLWYQSLNAGGNTGTVWELGAPNFGVTNTAHSAPNAWDINLNTAYTNTADVSLYTPFFDVKNMFNPYLSFWINYNTETNWDGVRMEFKNTTTTTNWTLLTPTVDTVNWYNMQTINCSGQPAWAGTPGNGWLHVQANTLPMLDAGNGPNFVQFRFTFCSDFSVTYDGFTIDDFCFAMPAPYDAGVPQITSPVGSAPAGTCDSITVTIKNFGYNPLTSLNVYYSIDSFPPGNPVTYGPFLWTGNLAAGQSTTWTIPTCYTVPSGTFGICSWTSLITQTDGNIYNDTSCINLFGLQTLHIDSLSPYCDDFDGTGTSYWYSQLAPGGNAGTNWELGTPGFGATNSAYSAPNAWDLNLNSAYTNNADVYLNSSIFDIANATNPYLSFWINYNTDPFNDAVRLEYSLNGSGVWTLLNPVTGTVNWYGPNTYACSNQLGWGGSPGPGWEHVQANNLPMLNAGNPGQTVQFRFHFCSNAFTTLDGFSLDDFCFAMPAPFDAGIPQINAPGFSDAAGTCDTVKVVIKNFGYNPLTSLNVYYSIDDLPYGNPVTYGPFLWTGNLAAGATTQWTIPSCFTVPAGQYNICSWTSLINPQTDGNFFNDTSCTNSVGVPIIALSYTNSFCDDFENGNRGWSVETIAPGTAWELGTPAFGQTTGAFSPDTCWDVNLNTAPQANANTYLYSPIFDFTQAVNTKLSFYINFNTGIGADGVHLEFKKNTGAWVPLFSTGLTINWYNSVACSQAGWSGSSTNLQGANANGWALAKDSDLTTFNGPNLVQFRFKYCSGTFTSFPNDGFSIDDFCLIVPVPLTASPTTCHNTSNPPFIFPGQPITFDTDIENKGTTPLSSVVSQLFIDNALSATDTITYATPLTTGQMQNHVYSYTWITVPGVHTICNVTTYPNDSTDQNPTDDTLCCTLSVIDTVSVASGPYCPDFDNAPQWVTLNSFNFGPNTSWTLGTPNVGCMTGAHTGIKAWKTGPLNGNYPNRDSSALFTPAFNIQTNRTYKLSFWQQYSMEHYQDGGNVEFSTDYGATWNVLGTGGSVNWYDSWFITALGGSPPQPGWSLSSCAWLHPYNTICFQPQNGQTAYPVMFRFRFASDNTVNDLGWLIDDFCFEDIGPCPLGIEQLSSPSGLALGQNYPNPTNGMTSIDYLIPAKGKVVLNIVNLLGQVMDTPVNENEISGIHTVSFNANKLSPGIYYYSITFNEETLVKKMVITK